MTSAATACIHAASSVSVRQTPAGLPVKGEDVKASTRWSCTLPIVPCDPGAGQPDADSSVPLGRPGARDTPPRPGIGFRRGRREVLIDTDGHMHARRIPTSATRTEQRVPRTGTRVSRRALG
ncbi:hypothetical protein GCM10023200_55610 [Actinomycetospora chlora]|uniref:Uncharacterized protein n=1 Tax=Actinomycetospora chlora TaxID=663608 RepID=A0ABP9CJP1_9PSEU